MPLLGRKVFPGGGFKSYTVLAAQKAPCQVFYYGGIIWRACLQTTAQPINKRDISRSLLYSTPLRGFLPYSVFIATRTIY
jgi:hypothetical protein